jgi:S-adenosylmethionine synthetase
MVSQIGKPVNQPLAVDVKVRSQEPAQAFQGKVEEIVKEHLAQMKEIWKRLVNGEITVY